MPGAFDEPRDFAIEMIGKLPRDAKVMLELPVNFLELMKSDLKIESIDRRTNVAVALLPPSGKILLGRGRMPAKARFRMRLLVALAKEDMKRAHQIAVRQLYLGEEEVGRVTWRLEPGRRKLEKQGKQNA
ncbi:MAG: hypothetical protein HC855_12465 [Rhizobiales bacterium]|nr:hypothetical protein [Hyphomicrobiales bacterium]